MTTKSIFVAGLTVIIIAIATALVFVFFQYGSMAKNSSSLASKADFLATLENNPSATIFILGKISSVSDSRRTIEVQGGGKAITINVAPDVRIFSTTYTSGDFTVKGAVAAPPKSLATFSDIKVGQTVGVSTKIVSDATLVASQVLIYPN